MKCSRCGSTHVSVQAVHSVAKTATKDPGILWGFGRLILIVCTCGLWLLVGKRKATSKTKYKASKLAICQGCGRSWNV